MKRSFEKTNKILEKNEEIFLITLARDAITQYLTTGKKLTVKEHNVPNALLKTGACVVTIKKEGKLRGSIGQITSRQPIYLDVIDNAISAGFKDPHFLPLEEDELADLKISVSVLGELRSVACTSPVEAITYFEKNKVGVVLNHGKNHASFLPSEWKRFPDVRAFLGALCEKAGLGAYAWQDKETTFAVFDVQLCEE
ncbi:AmmeMemoRadiSam system protein A [Candidatus Woesearchaeota archaeon]|nr:AmmeMemoRadiSam system protein A [Candidatus Woesearchaeota archaeon]